MRNFEILPEHRVEELADPRTRPGSVRVWLGELLVAATCRECAALTEAANLVGQRKCRGGKTLLCKDCQRAQDRTRDPVKQRARHAAYRESNRDTIRANGRARGRAAYARLKDRTADEILAAQARLRPEGVKTCGECQAPLPLSYFYRHSGTADGLNSWCQECVAAKHRAQRARYAARSPERVLQDRARLRPTGRKRCRGCRVELPLARFSTNPGKPDGLAERCRPCNNAKLLQAALPHWEDLDLWQCVYCGADFAHVDHVEPIATDGSDEPVNLAPACAACNCSKRDRDLFEWRPDLFELVKDWPVEVRELGDLRESPYVA